MSRAAAPTARLPGRFELSDACRFAAASAHDPLRSTCPLGTGRQFEFRDNTKKALAPKRRESFFGAAGQIRTADLILTKDALCLLSYSSIGDREGTRTLDLQRDRLAF